MSASTSTEPTLNAFSYGVTIKARSDSMKLDILGELFPNVTTVSLVSRSFSSYDECISSCKQLMDDTLARFNKQEEVFKMGSEVNPVYSGQPTLSKDWAPGEVSRLWIYDRSMEKKGQIHAIGQARIFGSRQDDLRVIN